MKLKKYIEYNYSGSQKAFAREHDLLESVVSFLCNGIPVGRESMLKIKRATGGEVTLDDMTENNG